MNVLELHERTEEMERGNCQKIFQQKFQDDSGNSPAPTHSMRMKTIRKRQPAIQHRGKWHTQNRSQSNFEFVKQQ